MGSTDDRPHRPRIEYVIPPDRESDSAMNNTYDPQVGVNELIDELNAYADASVAKFPKMLRPSLRKSSLFARAAAQVTFLQQQVKEADH